jgi:hypothetical protein
MIIATKFCVPNPKLSRFFEFGDGKYAPFGTLYPAVNDSFVFIDLYLIKKDSNDEQQYFVDLIHCN